MKDNQDVLRSIAEALKQGLSPEAMSYLVGYAEGLIAARHKPAA